MLKVSPTLAGVSKGREGNFENRLFSNISSGKRSRGKIEDSGLNFRISWYKIGKILFVFLSLRDRNDIDILSFLTCFIYRFIGLYSGRKGETHEDTRIKRYYIIFVSNFLSYKIITILTLCWLIMRWSIDQLDKWRIPRQG